MRKRFRTKKRSCALCKPHKMGKVCRWKAEDLDQLKEFERTSNALEKTAVTRSRPITTL